MFVGGHTSRAANIVSEFRTIDDSMWVLTLLSSLRKRLAREADREKDQDQTDRDFDGHLETGFQLATFQGPLCAEPVEGLAYFVENLEIDRQALETEQGALPRTSKSYKHSNNA